MGINCHYPNDIKIGNYVITGSDCHFMVNTTHNYDRTDIPICFQGSKKGKRRTVIGDDVWIGRQVLMIAGKHIYRSGTSVGANVRESKHAQSDADFLSKISIAYKEADETDCWLNLLHDNGYLNDDQFSSLNKDCIRVIKVLTSIVKTMRKTQ